MSTAPEVNEKIKSMSHSMALFRASMDVATERILDDIFYLSFGREVCSRRARKLRKRGDTVKFFSRTKTGKARYRWKRGPVLVQHI